MAASNSQLFQPIKVGDVTLNHRVVLAPLTRFRADVNHVPLVPLVKDYYTQRASEPGTLLITEATFVHPRAGGYTNVPGIWSDAQIEAWKEIVDAVHDKGSYIYLQIWALGRTAQPEQLRSEDPSYPHVSASDIPMSGRSESPRPLTVEEIKEYTQYFAEAAKNAVHKAGFDGVEVHGANGYLIEQFLKEASNRRTDQYGGSPENQARFALEVVDAVVKAVGPRKTGLRLSPWSTFQDVGVKDPVPTYSHLVKELKKAHPTLAYIHVVDPRVDGVAIVEDVGHRSNEFIREIWTEGPGGIEAEDGRRLISAGNYDLATGAELADTKGDLVAYGRQFISNPDLPYRLKYNVPLTPYDRSTFYLAGSSEPRGYTDYPFAPRAVPVAAQA
ncbi:hypothetical protein V5O48_006396 [Marasmius crinis-equi]|uniref:NADH:flavin oxidoreductase/NADH oxidase N-terminal domain-containing protein n=1 Tax=Marasmius crinis-equi TaxID=585013 RepID=A0ABR3FJM0_9AGAR